MHIRHYNFTESSRYKRSDAMLTSHDQRILTVPELAKCPDYEAGKYGPDDLFPNP